MTELPSEDLCDVDDPLVRAGLGFAVLVDALVRVVVDDTAGMPEHVEAEPTSLDFAVLGLISLRRSLGLMLAGLVDRVDVPTPETPSSIASPGDLLR